MRIAIKVRHWHDISIQHHATSERPPWMAPEGAGWRRLMPSLHLTYPDGSRKWWPNWKRP